MDEMRKQFADEVMEVIQKELKLIMDGKAAPRSGYLIIGKKAVKVIGSGGGNLSECDERMVMCLNRIGHEVRKLGFKAE